MARPLLVVIALWQFMERGKYPEVVVSCMLQLWRSHVSRGRWPGLHTDLSRKDTEARPSSILNSRTNAGSFASFEQLGVTPPPAGGWIPRDTKEEAKDGSRGTGKEAHTEWWSNIKTSEWIYHSTEDKYFHVPSSTLWERRVTECCDPIASPHTYCRVDAVHLQALSHFAKTADTALLPMVWKAWVFYTRKRTGHHAVVRPPPPPPAEGPSSKESDQQDVAKDGSRSQGLATESGEQTDLLDAPVGQKPSGEAAIACGQGSPDAAAGKGVIAAEDTSEAPLGQSEAELINAAGAALEQIPSDTKSLKKALTSTADTFDAITKGLAPVAAALSETEESSLVGGRPRGWCLCFRVRGWGKTRCASDPTDAGIGSATLDVSSKGINSEAMSNAKTTSTAGGGPGAGGGRESQSSAVSWTEEEQEPVQEAAKPVSEKVDKHLRRLNQFLAEVKRNPQRLITHIERRRAEKTHLAFVVI